LEIVAKVGALIDAYLLQLRFRTDENGEFDGSPYDLFLKRNGLPRQPGERETDLEYGRRLRRQIHSLVAPKFVNEGDGRFLTHSQPFRFGREEFAGLKVFLAEPGSHSDPVAGVGNCITCHAPPAFTDFAFHNTGAAQEEYDAIHGAGEFALLDVPSLKDRNQLYDANLPSSPLHPDANGRFRSIPAIGLPGYTDLGLWNIFANPDVPEVQRELSRLIRKHHESGSASALLPRTIALFKTPGLRDLGHSAPYLHTGRMDSLVSVMEFYRKFSQLARSGVVRNADSELAEIQLTPSDAASLIAFLRSLNEDYE
jgi:cytochrome c peroxidase